MKQYKQTVEAILPLNEEIMNKASDYVDSLTKPLGSLGRIEELAIQLAGITDREKPTVEKPAIIVAAADHGITAEGVSAYPQEVTKQMIANFLNGGAAINVFGRQIGADVHILDVGVNGEVPGDGYIDRKVMNGTNNFLREDAMSVEQAVEAIEAGMLEAERLIEAGHEVLIIGEMGIGNTTASSALIAAFTGANVAEVVGRGTGLDDRSHENKINIINEALKNRQVDKTNGLETLAKVGGLEIAALSGVILKAAAMRIPVIVDGLISTAAALTAYELCPMIKGHLIISHASVEPGQQAVFQYLNKKPLLQLDLRLGEGTGAALSYPLLKAATAILTEMATFANAGVSGKED